MGLPDDMRCDVAVGYQPIGNFNDMSRATCGSDTDIMAVVSGEADTVDLRPMEIIVDGKLHRVSPGYTSLGWAAGAASIFDNKEARGRARNSPEPLKLITSVSMFAGEYFKHRNEYLPPFHTSPSPEVRRAVTDVMAVNLPNMGRIIRLEGLPYLTDEFAYNELDVSRLLPNLPFLAGSLTGHMPNIRLSEIKICFEEPSGFVLQNEGESTKLGGVGELIIRKGGEIPSIKILHPRPINL